MKTCKMQLTIKPRIYKNTETGTQVEARYSEHLKRFTVDFNGKIFSYVTFNGMNAKVIKLRLKYHLHEFKSIN